MGKKGLATAVLILVLFEVGCTGPPEARYVYQDGEFGVIGIPMNTPLGKENFLGQAHSLMREHFPDGYEIVRAEEVVEGDRTLQTDRKAELDSEPSFTAANQLIKLGKIASTKSVEQRDMVKIVESRIIYKRRSATAPAGSNGFAAVATVTPQYYLDPNQAMREHSKLMLAKAKSSESADKHEASAAATKRVNDAFALKASHDTASSKSDPGPSKR